MAAATLPAAAAAGNSSVTPAEAQPRALVQGLAVRNVVGWRGCQVRSLASLKVDATAAADKAGGRAEAATFAFSKESSDASSGRRVAVVDNYDSFTYNLCQYLGQLKCAYEVYRNDELSVEELARLDPRGILISPGPGCPQDSGISLETVLKLGPTIPIFGVCMGLQCMGEAYGGNIVRAPHGVMHGKTSLVYHDSREEGLLAGLPNPFVACRYHSLVIDKATFPSDELEVTAWTSDGLIMGVRHKKYTHIEGVQFHPESIITENGMKIVENFVKALDQFEVKKLATPVHKVPAK